MSKMVTLVSTLIGKDLATYSLPVFMNEPMTILQKTAEFMGFTEYITKASKEKDPFMRMINVAIFTAATNWCCVGRIAKPFISLLGETYELVTDKFKYYGENVSQNPPLIVFHGEGEGFKVDKTVEARMQFTGTQVQVKDQRNCQLSIYCQDQ